MIAHGDINAIVSALCNYPPSRLNITRESLVGNRLMALEVADHCKVSSMISGGLDQSAVTVADNGVTAHLPGVNLTATGEMVNGWPSRFYPWSAS